MIKRSTLQRISGTGQKMSSIKTVGVHRNVKRHFISLDPPEEVFNLKNSQKTTFVLFHPPPPFNRLYGRLNGRRPRNTTRPRNFQSHNYNLNFSSLPLVIVPSVKKFRHSLFILNQGPNERRRFLVQSLLTRDIISLELTFVKTVQHSKFSHFTKPIITTPLFMS